MTYFFKKLRRYTAIWTTECPKVFRKSFHVDVMIISSHVQACQTLYIARGKAIAYLHDLLSVGGKELSFASSWT